MGKDQGAVIRIVYMFIQCTYNWKHANKLRNQSYSSTHDLLSQCESATSGGCGGSAVTGGLACDAIRGTRYPHMSLGAL